MKRWILILNFGGIFDQKIVPKFEFWLARRSQWSCGLFYKIKKAVGEEIIFAEKVFLRQWVCEIEF